MKAVKIVAGIFIAVLVLLAVGVALALTPAVQTWAARRVLAGQPGTKIEIGRVAAGTSAAELRDVRIVQNGMVITAKAATARYSAWDYLSHHRVNVADVALTDVVVDMRASAAPPPAATAPAGSTPAPQAKSQLSATTPSATTGRGNTTTAAKPFDGILGQIQLPVDLKVDRLSAAGDVLLPKAQTAKFDVTGSNIATGARGQIEFHVHFVDPEPGAPLTAAHVTGTLSAHLTSDRRVDLIELNADTAAEGARLPHDHLKLEAKLAQAATGRDEDYSLRTGFQQGGTFVPLATVDARFDAARKEMAGKWELGVRSEQLATLLADAGLPPVHATGNGTFAVRTDTYAVTTAGKLNADVASLEKLSPALAAIGGVRLDADFGGALADNVARLERLQANVTATDGRRIVEIHAVQPVAFSLADQRVQLANPQAELARVALTAVPLAWAQPFVKGLAFDSGSLSATLAIEAEPDGSRVRARAVEPVALRDVTVRQGQQKLVENLSFAVRPTIEYTNNAASAELADLKLALPAGDALAGQLHADVTQLKTTPAVAFRGNLDGKIVAALRPYLPIDPGPLALSTKFDGSFSNGVLRLAQTTATVNREAGPLLAALELQQPIEVKLDGLTFSVAKADASVARVRLGEVPLAWAQRFVANSQLAGALTGATVDVTARSVDELALNTSAPIELRGVDATLDGKPMVQKLDVTADLSATKRGQAVTFDVRRVDLKQGATPLAGLRVQGQAQLGREIHLTAKGQLEADAAALLLQPVAAPYATLRAGKLTVGFDATVAGKAIQAKAEIAGKGLVARTNASPLGDVALKLDAMMKADGSGTIALPLTVTANGNRKSDVALNGTFARQGEAFTFNGKISSTQLVVDDLQPFAGLAPSTPTAATPAAPATSAPKPATSAPNRGAVPAASRGATAPAVANGPAWKGIGGRIEVDLKQVFYGKDYTISGVHGTAAVTDQRLALDGLEGKFKDNPFKVAAAVTYAANQPKPYGLTGTVDVSNFDVGAILQAANPNEKPELETKVTIKANLNGSAATLPELAQNAYGKFDVTGSKGVLRALGKKGEAVSTVSSIIGIIGAARQSSSTVAVGELGRALSELAFDQFTMHVERGADLSLKLTAIEFISSSMRLTGSGSIANQAGVPIQNQVAEVQLTLAGKDQFAQMLDRAGLLGGQQDDKGYYPMRTPSILRGTPANFDSRDLYRIIGENAARAAIGSFLGGR